MQLSQDLFILQQNNRKGVKQVLVVIIMLLCSPISVDSAECLVADGSSLNTGACTCGVEECTASTGLICFSSVGGGSCRKDNLGQYGFPRPTTNVQCSSTGERGLLIESKDSCEAAAVSMGLSDTTADWKNSPDPPGCYYDTDSSDTDEHLFYNYQFSSTSKCSSASSCICVAASTCAITDGSEANTGPCQCGSVTCLVETGLICYDTIGGGSCRKNTPGAFGYQQVISGRCDDVTGRQYIKTITGCNTAAERMGLSDTTANSQTHSAYPPGCRTSGHYPDTLNFDPNPTSSQDCSFDNICICVAAADCTITDGSGTNGAMCYCGTAFCTQETGLICYSTLGGGSCRKNMWGR